MKPLFGLLLLLAPSTVQAQAQAQACRVPAILPRAAIEGPTADQPARRMAIGGYTLALTWSPDYCRDRRAKPADRFRCGGEGPPRYGFTLHGLWPDGQGKSWPQYCRAAPLVPDRVMRATVCATPDVQLIQHEYAKHGTCMAGVAPAAYFARSTALYRALRYPDMDRLSRGPLTAATFSAAFAAANPGLSPAAVKLNLDRQGWLEEVWLCLDTRFRPMRCRGGGDPARTVKIWRGRT